VILASELFSVRRPKAGQGRMLGGGGPQCVDDGVVETGDLSRALPPSARPKPVVTVGQRPKGCREDRAWWGIRSGESLNEIRNSAEPNVEFRENI
jgi:hypothetical protein